MGRLEWYAMIEIQSVEKSKTIVGTGEVILIKVQAQEVFAVWSNLTTETWNDVSVRTWEDLHRKIL